MKIDPGGGDMGGIRSLQWLRCERASARFYYTHGLPAPGPAPPFASHYLFRSFSGNVQFENIHVFVEGEGDIIQAIGR